MRKFALRNSIGEIYPMDGTNGILFLNPQGLGFSSAPTFADNKYGFFADVDNSSEPMNQVVGDIAFIGDPYGKYQAFVNWLNKGYPLELMYQPKNTQFYRSVEVSDLSKGELELSGILRCTMSFNCLTPWYKPNPIDVNLVPDEEGIKRYSYSYPYSYAASAATSAVEIVSDGHIDGAIRLSAVGPLVSPVITLTNLGTGEVVGKMALDITVDSGQVLEFSTVPSDSYITVDGEDVIGAVDIMENVFFRLPRNTACSLSMANSGSASLVAQIKVYDYYRSV